MISYSLSIDKNSHYFHVSMDFAVSGSINVSMPVWTPGSYLIREFSKNVKSLRASEGGKALVAQKISKNSWKIYDANKRVRVEYDVYAHEHTTNSSYIGSDHATINGASVFMFAEGMETEEITVKINSPKVWKTISTWLPKRSGKLYAKNYDVLVDSPIEIGNHSVHKFIARGKVHEVAIYSHGKFDEKRFVNDLKKIVNASFTVFKEMPYERYVFICHFGGDSEYGGLEHLNSTLCIAPVLSMKNDVDYKNTLGLFSHEFFHLWNVKRLRPRPLGPFDYSRENYTTSLWISEGITSYYDNLILRRAGIISAEEYLIELSEDIGRLLATPGRNAQSAEESSFDTWIKFYRPNEESINSAVSYYNKGAILGWL
ncbi:MAG: M61 family metallopeptidase, partial [Candidatus Aenigmarchaeota archaeon]|nr:M61 family metallopeptidase [Candidatus Aenigmarchaeota archaeon]